MPDSGIKLPENRIHLFDPVGLINDSYGSYRPSNYAVRPRHPIKSYDSFSETNGGVVVRSDDSLTDCSDAGIRPHHDHSYKPTNEVDLKLVEDDQFEVSTPRLWKPKPIPQSPFHPTTPTHHQYQSMSPNSRTQMIAKGRKELMDMVRDLPESFYELSLKDIVEQKVVMEGERDIDQVEEKKTVKEIGKEKNVKKQKTKKKSGRKVKKTESKKKMVRSKSVDSGGFLLRTSVFPSFLGSRKKKKSKSIGNSFKIDPMPKAQPPRSRSMKSGEKDWWKRKSCMLSESDESGGLTSNSASSSSSSSRSNSSNGRRSNRFLRSFCFFNGRRIRENI